MATVSVEFASAFNRAVVFTYEFDSQTGALQTVTCVNELPFDVWVQASKGAVSVEHTFPPGASQIDESATNGSVKNGVPDFNFATRAPA